MAVVSGRLIFDKTRTGQPWDWQTGIADVPVVLKNLSTGERTVTTTDANGNYSFQNVADGNYQIMEAYGKDGGFPPITFAKDPPPGATNLDAVSPTTINVTVSNADITNQNFLNGPVTYTPIQTIMDSSVIVSPENLITKGENGTFGGYPAGTPANTGGDPNPYPDIDTQFVYALPNPQGVVPVDGGYTVQNIMSNAVPNEQNMWWRVADHTKGDETGRMMVVNGNHPGAVIFGQKVNVEPNAYYLLSSWIMNLSKEISHAEPALGVQVLGENGKILYDATLGALIPMKPNNPEWKQIGTVINSQDNSSLTVQFISKGPAAWGNDYAIDDVMLNKVQVPEYKPVKSADKSAVNIGDIITYTVTLENNGKNPHTNVRFHDALPDGISFVDGSVTVNGAADTAANPASGFIVPDVEGGGKLTVIFRGRVDRVPDPNPAVNFADIHYAYSPVLGGIPWNVSGRTNDAAVRLISADLITAKKSVTPAISGGVLNYSIDIKNAGPDTAQNPVVTDIPPPELSNVMFSTDGGLTWMSWTGQAALTAIAPNESAVIQIKGEVNSMAAGNILNTASVSSPTHDPNTANNTSNTTTPIEQSADISIVKTGAAAAAAGGTVTYNLIVSNAGPSAAADVVVGDSVPAALLNPQYSVDNGATWNNWTGSYAAGTLAAGQSAVLQIRAQIDPALPMGGIENTASVSSPTKDPNTANNTSTVNTSVRPSADLSVTKTADREPLPAGEQITYTLTAVNNGPSTANNVQILDTVPAELSNISFSADNGATWSAWTGSYQVAVLAKGGSAQILIRGTSSAAAADGVITNAATVKSDTPDPDLINNTTEIKTTVNKKPDPPRPYVDLEITKTADKSTVNAGEAVTFTLSVRNRGADDAVNVAVGDSVPSWLTAPVFSADNGATWAGWTGSYAVGGLANGVALTLLLRGTVDPDADPETSPTLTNTATVQSDTPDPDTGNNSSSASVDLTASADVSVTKTASPNPAVSGEKITYNITIKNAGPSAARDVILVDPVVEEVTDPQVSTDGGTTWQTWVSPFFIGKMAKNETKEILLRGTVNAAVTGKITNTAVVGASTDDPDIKNNITEIETPVQPTADISIVKTADNSPAVVGGRLTYTLVISNAGPSYAEGVTVSDNLPTELGGTEFSADGGITWRRWTGSANIGTMAAGTSAKILLRGTVNDIGGESIVNTASVMNLVTDRNLGNNRSSVQIPVTVPSGTDLRITKTAHPNVVRPCGCVTFNITVLNAGPYTAVNTTLVDVMPRFITRARFSTNGGKKWYIWNGTLNLGNLAPNTSRKILISGVMDCCACGRIKNTARVFSDTPETNPHDNISFVTVIIK